MKVRFMTVGCKVNQYETQGMREALQRAGFEAVDPRRGRPHDKDLSVGTVALASSLKVTDIDFVIVNTCTVTANADKESRYWIRRAKREYPGAKIVVTGCAVERDRKAFEQLAETDFIVHNREKAEIVNQLLARCASSISQENRVSMLNEEWPSDSRHRYIPLSISGSEGRSRAFVKIQEGCNHACAFCCVVLVRGRSRSRPLQEVVEEVIRLRDNGYREVVFAGIQLGAYGLDFRKDGISIGLMDILEACSRIEGIERLRLSSIEPMDVSPSLIEALRFIPKCCPHLHIPLQSGDDEILRRMNRRYNRLFYLDLVKRLKSEIPDFCLTLDVMAGFPGEEESHFQNTVDLLEQLSPVKCHVFPYSRREGTRASKMKDLSRETVHRRAEVLLELEARLGRKARLPYLGRTLTVLVEQIKENHPLLETLVSNSERVHGRNGWYEDAERSVVLEGLTANYLKVCFGGKVQWIGQTIPVRLVSLQENSFWGEVITG